MHQPNRFELSDNHYASVGLPLYKNPTQIIGDFKAFVEHVEHPNLIKYFECFKNKTSTASNNAQESVTLIFENLPTGLPIDFDILKATKSLLDGLDYLHNKIDTPHGLITNECIVWCENTLKLSHWPLKLLSGSSTVLLSGLAFIAPEQVKYPDKQSTKSCDIWSAGLALISVINPRCKLPENPCVLAFCDDSRHVLDLIDGNLCESQVPDPEFWNEFFRMLLQPDPAKRADLNELYTYLNLERQEYLKSDSIEAQIKPNFYEVQQQEIMNLNISEIYHLWRLSIGRNYESEQKQDDRPPIFRIPNFIVNTKQTNNEDDCEICNRHLFVDIKPKPISLNVFKLDMSRLDAKIFYPLILTDQETLEEYEPDLAAIRLSECVQIEVKKYSEHLTFADLNSINGQSTIQNQISESSQVLPIVIKEADCAYQCERLILFKRLLAGFPYLESQLRHEASVDIPPYYRAQVWSTLLGVSATKSKQLYDSIDKTTPIAIDRQISVDIPRCHQYNELMASSQGHQKLTRILKAWLKHNVSEYVYWQGLDSLAAPFLLLNFHNEAVAFACFNAFVNKYLRGFFKQDNQLVVQEYLSMFTELLYYHDPALAEHLEQLGFLPNLYAIPWFLTMFTHVLPLHRILHVWDSLLLGDKRFPLCVGLAVLNQLRDELLEYNFNDCIVAFSDLPEIDIERCIRDATNFYNSSPVDR